MAAAPETAPIARVAMVEDDRDTRARLAASIRAQGSLRLVAEYAERRAQRPSDAPSHYLLGRVMDDPERALAEHQEAIWLDPRLAWAYVALAYNLMALERYPEAAAALTEVLKNPAHDSSAPYLYAVAAVGAGQMEDAAKRLAPVARTHADHESVWNARWLLALALRQWPAANALLQERSASGDNSPEEKEEMW